MLQGALIKRGLKVTLGFDSVDVISILGKNSFVGLLRQQPGSIQRLSLSHLLTCPFALYK